MPLTAIAKTGRKAEGHRPFPRAIVGADGWQRAVRELVEATATLLGLWGDKDAVHLALLEELSGAIAVFTLPCPDGKFPSVGAHHPAAIRLERTIADLYGLKPTSASDTRHWLDLGFWGVTRPLGKRRKRAIEAYPYAFLPVEGEDLHQIPVGPVHAGIIEPGHFRFTANGETVVRLEQRLGYVHKGTESLMTGATLDKGAKLAGRASGDSTVAYALAFAQAIESALQIDVPARAVWLRALMAELERLANHFGDIGAICNDASFSLAFAECGILRERTLRAAQACFGHRLMMDRIVPGGVTDDLSEAGIEALRALLETVRSSFPGVVDIYDNTASLQDRTVTTGYLSPTLARSFGAGGYVGRASGRAFDARKAVAYAPYDELEFEAPVRDDGDVNARVWIRIREVEQSLKLIEQIIERLPEGKLHTERAKSGGVREGLALVEAFRGDVLIYVRIGEDGLIERCHMRDASWFQWPLLEVAIEGNIVADFPLCNKSFNCSYSGHDL
ncbi:hydrogenase expression protein HypE [Methyloceanibacter sp.]|uniref:hydrogenase large subunit n=1 Tax=Methyloceanibacter sp. TaxID=1965321 RepID=UPI003D6CC1AA